MFCIKCGQHLEDEDQFCCKCGYPVTPEVSAEAETPEVAPVSEVPDTPAIPKPRQTAAIVTLVLVFLFGLLAFMFIRTDSPGQDAAMPWFTVQDGVLYFDNSQYTGGSTLIVPESINGQTVREISDDCFAYCTDLVYIQLPETVTAIGNSAFYGCSDLRGIKLPESLISIGHYAFGGCVNLEAVCIPYSLESIGNNLFYNCHNLVYFFYPGPSEEWYELPLGNLRDDSYVYCADGIRPAE